MNRPQAQYETKPLALSKTSSAILHTLLYFDVFNYPLTASEILQFANHDNNPATIQKAIDDLKSSCMIRQEGELYSVNEVEDIFNRRISGNENAAKFMKTAKRISSFISLFPFVRGVMISGSLSKGFMDGKSDIDFFILTEKNRLWMCRSVLAAFRKTLPASLKKYFCINYFLDTSDLEIPEKNIFTATEIAFIHPTYNHKLYNKFIEANQWIRSYYPNKPAFTKKTPGGGNYFPPRLLIEWILSGKSGAKLEEKLHTFMTQRWQKKFRSEHLKEEFELNFRTRKNASKQHEKGHQAKILNLYANNILAFEHRHGVTLSE